ncbi:PilZ domain-containing protein [Parasalinivibrio latis]|uniref:PilZ domain-containing protein n=1 Tax=Parasalinivibrio latis TaxID=2952610 RepID=UPI0030E4BFAD
MSQDEYFSVHAHLTVNVEPLAEGEHIPDKEAFEAEIPVLFRIARECAESDESMEKDLAAMKIENSHALLNYLNTQNKKLDLLLNFMLANQDNPKFRHKTETFGASSLTYFSDKPLHKGTSTRVKIFLHHPAAAIYCYGEVFGCKEVEGRYAIGIRYTRLQEPDQDILIRAALHLQQKLLRQRALKREENK